MKTAEEWAKEIPAATECCNGIIDFKRGECISVLDCPKEMAAISAIIRAVQRDAIEAAAKAATSFLVGDPANQIPLRNPMPHEVAELIHSLLPTEP